MAKCFENRRLAESAYNGLELPEMSLFSVHPSAFRLCIGSHVLKTLPS